MNYESVFGLHSPYRQNVGDLGWSIKKAVKKVAAPVVQKVTAPVVQAVQKIEAKATAATQEQVAKIVVKVDEQVQRAQAVADQLGAQKLEELKNKTIQMAKDPVVQSTAIMAACTAVGAPEMGQMLARINIETQAAYQEFQALENATETERAIAAYNANPSSITAARIASNASPGTAALITRYNAEVDSRATREAMVRSGVDPNIGLSQNKAIIAAALIGGGLLFMLALRGK